jgi:hypothetical protein
MKKIKIVRTLNMNKKILYKETQKFTQWWLWLILTGLNLFFLFGIYKQMGEDVQFGNNPMSNNELLLTFCFTLIIIIFFLILRLETQINEGGIYVRFFPFHVTNRYYRWNTISKIYIRRYDPKSEYGGWSLRLGLFGKGKAYNVSGNMGLQIEFKNNKKLLIGTNQPDVLQKAIDHIKLENL